MSSSQVAGLGRDLLRLRQLQDMLDGKGKEVRSAHAHRYLYHMRNSGSLMHGERLQTQTGMLTEARTMLGLRHSLQSVIRSPNRPGSRRLASPGSANVSATSSPPSADAALAAGQRKGSTSSEVPIIAVRATQPPSSAPVVVGSPIEAQAKKCTTQVRPHVAT
jgi:hypothetical protein